MSNRSTTINLLGCLPLILCCLILGTLGFCGTTCQDWVQEGIHTTVNAFQGK